MNYSRSIALWFFSCVLVSDVTATDFEHYQLEQKQAFNRFKQQHLQEFDLFRQKLRAEKVEFSLQLSAKWGLAETTNHHKLVVYSINRNHKIVVDFKTEEVRFSSVNGHQPTVNKVVAMLRQSLSQQPLYIGKRGQTLAEILALNSNKALLNFAQRLLQEENVVDQWQLNQQLRADTEQEEQLMISQLASQQDDKVSLLYQHQLKQVSPNSIVTFNLQNNNLSKKTMRQQRLQSLVTKWSQKYSLSDAWLFGLIEVNSNFFQQAITVAPAYGLMLVTPDVMVTEVNRHSSDFVSTPTIQQLFEADTNIGYGAAYLNLLMTKGFGAIESPESRLYCALAAYRVGVAKVNQIFIGKGIKSSKRAVAKVNQLSTQQVLDSLINELPYDENRLFLKNVLAAIAKYR